MNQEEQQKFEQASKELYEQYNEFSDYLFNQIVYEKLDLAETKKYFEQKTKLFDTIQKLRYFYIQDEEVEQ